MIDAEVIKRTIAFGINQQAAIASIKHLNLSLQSTESSWTIPNIIRQSITMKSALAILLPCLVATSLPLFARAQILETITGAVVDQIVETIIDVVGVPLS